MDMLSNVVTQDVKICPQKSEICPQTGVLAGQAKSQSVADVQSLETTKALKNQGFCQGLSQSDTSCHAALRSEGDGIRTRNLWIDSPVL